MLVRFSERVTGVSGFVVSFRVLVFRKFGFGFFGSTLGLLGLPISSFGLRGFRV